LTPSPANTIYVSANGNDNLAGASNTWQMPFLTAQKALDVGMSGDSETMQLAPTTTGYGAINTTSKACNSCSITGVGLVTMDDLTISDATGQQEFWTLNNVYWNNIIFDNSNDTIGAVFINGGAVSNITYRNTGNSTFGMGSSRYYFNLDIVGDIDYFSTGFASQTDVITETFEGVTFSIGSSISINSPNVKIQFINCTNLPTLQYANGATSSQVSFQSSIVYPTPNQDYIATLNDNGKTLICDNVELVILNSAVLVPGWTIQIFSRQTTVVQDADSNYLAIIDAEQTVSILFTNESPRNFEVFFNGSEIPTSYLNITNAGGLMPTISVYDPPNMFLNGIDAAAVKVKLPPNSTVPLKGQYYNLYNIGTQLITVLDSDSNAPIANIASKQQVTVTRNYDNNTWFAIDSNQATLITLAGTSPTYTLAQYDKPNVIVNCTGTNAKLFLDDSTHLAGIGKQVLIINTGTTALNVYGTNHAVILFSLTPTSQVTAYYNGTTWLGYNYNQISVNWTPADASGAALTFSVTEAVYTKTNNQITFTATVAYPTTVNTNNAIISGLPYNASAKVSIPVIALSLSPHKQVIGLLNSSTKLINLYNLNTGDPLQNKDLSGGTLTLTQTYLS
jgi:hypothetical protein